MISRFLRAFTDNHLWIATAAAALTAFTSREHNLVIEPGILLFAFGTSLCAYHYLNLQPKLFSNIKGDVKSSVYWMVYGVAVSIYAFYLSEFRLILYALVPGFIVFIYILPIIPVSDFAVHRSTQLIPGRNNAWFKISLIALAWTITTYFIPVFMENESPEWNKFTLGFFQRFSFIFGITIPFDVRDITVDPAEMRTLGQRLGPERSIKVSIAILFLSAALSTCSYLLNYYDFFVYLSAIITILLSCIIIYFIKGKNKYYFTGLLDGMMILPILLNITMSYIID